MVGRWGMSDAMGPISVIPRDGSGPLFPGAPEVSPETQKLVDDEVRRIVAESHEQVSRCSENRGRLDALAGRCSSTRRSTRTTPTRPQASLGPGASHRGVAAAARSTT